MFLACQRICLALLTAPRAAWHYFLKTGEIYSTRGSLLRHFDIVSDRSLLAADKLLNIALMLLPEN
jgi:hypothetical protein